MLSHVRAAVRMDERAADGLGTPRAGAEIFADNEILAEILPRSASAPAPPLQSQAREAGCTVLSASLASVTADGGKVVGVGVLNAEKIAESISCGAVVNAAGPYANEVDAVMREAAGARAAGAVRLRNEATRRYGRDMRRDTVLETSARRTTARRSLGDSVLSRRSTRKECCATCAALCPPRRR